MTNPRNIQPTGRGGAHYIFENDMPPTWLVSAVPGAAEAKAAWEAENAKGQELYREFQASGRALVKFRSSDPLASELEAAERAHKARQTALEAQARRSVAALRRFDALAYSGAGTPEEYRALAAKHALKKHEEAVAAWETLKAAIKEREQAQASAGAPGRDWRESAPVGYRNLLNVETVVRPMIEGFDVRALQLAANGERVPSAAEREAAQRKLEEDLAKAMRNAARQRERRQNIAMMNAINGGR